MKKYILPTFLGLGWALFILSLISGFFFNKYSIEANTHIFRPITWQNHKQLFNGAVQCNLTDDDLLERKKELKEVIFQKVKKREAAANGFVYYFNDDPDLLNSVLEFVQKEKACCPFFKFDISILPFDRGLALQISGSEEAIEILKDFENNEF